HLMSTALAVCHGAFGRVSVYRLDRPMRTPAPREGHLTYLLNSPSAVGTIGDVPFFVGQTSGGAVNPWQPHSFQPSPGAQSAVFLVAYLCDRWLDRDRALGGSLRFGANGIEVGTTIRSIAVSLAHVVVTNASYRIVNRYLNQLVQASFDASWTKGGGSVPPGLYRQAVDFRV